ncbi:MAG TPA: zinc-binding dehydrogenase [Cytophagales bacterium]|nr:zinc-binding dehydrogenase [Cytophagales bacterium]
MKSHTASRPESMDFCSFKLNADHVINYQTTSLREYINTFTKGGGLEYIFDTVGGDTFTQTLQCLAPGGHLCTILPVSSTSTHRL